MSHHTHLVQLALFVEDSAGCLPLFFSPVYDPTSLLQLQSLFIYSSCGSAFPPLSCGAHWGELCHICFLWQACLFRVRVGKCPSPSLWQSVLLVSWKPSPLQAPCGGLHPCLLLQVCLFRVCVGKCSSPILRQRVPHGEVPLTLTPELRAPTIFVMCPFFSVAYYSVFFFRAAVSLSRGLCWFFSKVAVGEPCATYYLPMGLPSRLGGRCLAVREPSWFLHIPWCGGAMCCAGGAEVLKFYLFLVIFPVWCVSSILGKFFL
jgi:hypothetical protein